MIFFVYVRYVFDKVKKVTTSNHVKGFRPKHSRDFKAGEVYSAYWEGDSRTAGSYYEAEILHMTEDPAAPEDNTVAEMALAEPQEQPPEQPRQDSRVLLPHAGSETVEEPLPSPPVCSIMGNGMVHLANNVCISKDAFDMLMAIPKESLFIKRAATSIWSSEVLAKRSFSGTLSNRYFSEAFFRHYAASRGFSVEETNKCAKNIRLWLSQKTCELRRKKPSNSKQPE
ncbi:hypothetical protein HPB50_015353 [Hyalomma asiaticum]|uniref:Uncharacterized protein n=1 Tax=Hyalomma asiaticum TaxID=266040 RepID=A0ACB7TIA1_HYAAI|nr:hypothetical protein HPB50_015353 [Hyalomma asiaticum]